MRAPGQTVERRRELVDGMSSWWSGIHGHRHPILDEAARGQLERRATSCSAASPTRRPPGEAPGRHTPDALEHVFFADSGSVSVTAACPTCGVGYCPGRSSPTPFPRHRTTSVSRTCLRWPSGTPTSWPPWSSSQ
ncbi:aminotransferase class III-fold pyridoxal phosphate-dependent enzyme [Streptomyces flaveolus]|uniref:aminotransferase class III-fold pyridoxal phosphate-dependent enzyme n=1 Tax=Streptomyces flaveolus TaxID=67297 RepID=UPI0036FDE2C6